ncbi:hypothetical protein ACFV1L_29035 [Kitasatospora sp. NPDC059646]|uniref:hypothetical protein n=1 Tax=Kitasatospora sp. NPDC059646 TaxID=3346893 RepID=UPI00367DD7CD
MTARPPTGRPVLAVADPGRRLLAVACADTYGEARQLGLYETGERPRLLRRIRCRHHIAALAFHPGLPLLAVGTGAYDGGCFFEGQLLMVPLDGGRERELFAERMGRQVLAVHWLDDTRLRLHLAPYDDDRDDDAHHEAHLVVLERPDWTAVAARSIPDRRLQGPRVPFPRTAGAAAADAAAARQLTDRLLTAPAPRHDR